MTVSNLYWLGRYMERVYTTLSLFTEGYDNMIEDPEYYKEFLADMGNGDMFLNSSDFVEQYLYNKDLDYSLISALNKAMDNGIILREEITSDSLGYIQLAHDDFLEGENYKSPLYSLVTVKDDLYAFWGSIENCVYEQSVRDILWMGNFVERLELYTRLDYDFDTIRNVFIRLNWRIQRLVVSNNVVNQFFFDKLSDLINGEAPFEKPEVLKCLTHIVSDQ